jgi:DNA modification methylase
MPEVESQQLDHESEIVQTAALKPHPRNYRGHPERQIEHLKQSIREHGVYRNLVTANDLTVLAGHGMLLALIELNVADVRVVRMPFGPDDPRALKLLAADNELSRLAETDQQALLDLLVETDNLLGTGFDSDAFDALSAMVEAAALAAAGTSDATPRPIDPPVDPVTKPGDLWVIGAHRVLCGDARNGADYERALGERLPSAVVMDPPYGVGIGAKNRALDEIDRAGRALDDLQGDGDIDEVRGLWKAAFPRVCDAMPAGTPWYCFGPQGGDLGLLLLLLREGGLDPRHVLIWKKNRPSFSIGRLDYDYQHEPLVYGWKKGAAHPWYADGTRSSVLEFDRPQASKQHATMKPTPLLCHLIANSTRKGDVILDPFCGSGSTMVAAAQLGRIGVGIEISPAYCDVIVDRMENTTGLKGTLA